MPFYPVGAGGGISGNVIRIIADSGFVGQTYYIKDANDNVLKTGTIPASGTKDVTILENGKIKIECNNTIRIINIPNEFGLYKVKFSQNVNYTVVIHKTRWNIDEEICTYENDAVDMIPAHMNYETGLFDYGSWENAFFMPKPCMVRTNGTVDYFLDPDDYGKKLDGTPSDIADESYDGNAFVQVPHMWTKVTESDNKIYINIANYKVDNSYVDWAFHDRNGESAPYTYWSIYEASKQSNANILRSLSGKTAQTNLTGNNFINYTRANGNDYDIQTFSNYMLRNLMIVMISCTTDSQKAFGKGNCESSVIMSTGSGNTKGLFWGSESTNEVVKVFGIENPWGNSRKITVGLMAHGSSYPLIRYKLTRGTEDGTSLDDYSVTNATGFLTGPTITPGTSGYFSSDYTVANGFAILPKGLLDQSASNVNKVSIPDATYYTLSTSSVTYFGAGLGGGVESIGSTRDGAFCINVGLNLATSAGAGSTAGTYLNLTPAVNS